ncbi:MAG TPA: membrane protein insertion efficiency factor YidD [Candidatus Acidoferrales bacterium]|nr:membrane protein insertion efficiency factor YidD [Candidatus Acidoferrales bacterium]
MKVIEFKTDYRDKAVIGSASMAVEGEACPLDAEAHRRSAALLPPARSLTSNRSRSFGAWILLGFLRFYIVCLSPVFGGACKFYPSCSNYAVEAVTKHGARQGFVLAAKRLMRCRPFTKGGFDPVPDDVPHSKHSRHVNRKLQVASGTEMKIGATERRML